MNFVAAVAYHFSLVLPAAFTQPGAHLLAEPCTRARPMRHTPSLSLPPSAQSVTIGPLSMHARFRLSVRTSDRFIGSSSGGGVCSAIHADTVHIFHTDTVMSVSLEKCHRNRWSATSLDMKINHVQGDPLNIPLTCSFDSSGSWLAATLAIYCPGKMAEPPKSKSTGGFNHPDGSLCINDKLLTRVL